MTSFVDLNKLVESLQSTKIKERNEGLNDLELFTNSRLKLSSKEFKILLNSIIRLINLESNIYVNNKSSSVGLRLTRASYNLRVLIFKSINLAPSTRNVRCRTYIDLILTIKDIFFINNDILEPCSVNFLNILSTILSVQYVKDHLNNKDWQLIYNFIIKIINWLLNASEEETLLIESLNSLQIILQCENRISVNCLQLYKNENYLEILPILSKITMDILKKENSLLVYAFRIINKLIISFSTENFKFVSKLIRLGLHLITTFSDSRWDKVQDQFLIFLNLPITHELLSSTDLPQLTGDNLFLNDEDEIVANDESESNNEHVLPYKLGVLISNLSEKLINNGLDVGVEDIGITLQSEAKHWFQLKFIFLKSSKYQLWLLYQGVAKLITTYFQIKSCNKLDPQKSIASSSANKSKKSRVNLITESLFESRNAIEFFNTLISSKISEAQVFAFKILLFHLEVNANEKENARRHETKVNANQTTSENLKVCDELKMGLNVLLKIVLKTFDNDELSFWNLLIARAIVNISNVDSTYISQILKISLLSIKSQDTFQIACNLIFELVMIQQINCMELVDDSMINQLSTIIDLSEINGPFKISNESFLFWYTLRKLSADLNLSNHGMLANKIQHWLLMKWDSTFLPNHYFIDLDIDKFLYWLSSGNSIEFNPIKPLSLESFDLIESFLFLEHVQELTNFLLLKEHTPTDAQLRLIEIDSITIGNQLASIMNRIILTTSQFAADAIEASCYFQWIMTLCKILAKTNTSKHLCNEVKSLYYQASSGLEAVFNLNLDNEQNKKIIQLFNSVNLSDQELEKLIVSRIPIEKLLSQTKCFETEIMSISRKRPHESEDSIDQEFSSVREASSPSPNSITTGSSYLMSKHSQYPPVLSFITKVNQYLNKPPSDNLIALVNYIEDVESKDLLPSILFIIKHGLSQSNQYETLSLIKLIRIVGENLLSNQVYERDECTIVVVSKLLYIIFPLLENIPDESFIRDFFDICNWIHQCGVKGLIHTELSIIEYSKFLIQFMTHNDERIYSNKDLKTTFLSIFTASSNNMKYQLIDPIANYLTILTVQNQGSIYNDLFQSFFDPQQSVETGGTYAIFFTRLSICSKQILQLALFNLLECSRFSFFIPYLTVCLVKFCEIIKVSCPKDIFKLLKYEILRNWWKYNSINQIPYSLFQFQELQTFYVENYKELIAIAISSKISRENSEKNLLETLAELKQTSLEFLVSESIPLIISLSYATDGVRNDIFQKLTQYSHENFKKELKDNLLLIITEIIKLTDILDEITFLHLFPDNEFISSLIDSESTLVLEKSNDIKISVDSGVELIRRLVKKYGADFWTCKEIYFLLRRINLLISYTTSADQLIFHIRKVKLILALCGDTTLITSEVTCLIIETLSPLVKYESLTFDISLIYSQFRDLFNHKFPYDKAMLMVSKIVSFLLNAKQVSPQLVINIELFLRSENYQSPNSKLLLYSIGSIKNESVSIDSSIIEDCLNQDNVSPLTFNLVSTLFDKVNKFNHKGGINQVVKTLYKNDITDVSKSFKKWIIHYLSDFYLQGNCGEDFIKINEYNGITSESFKDDVHSLDYTLRLIMDSLNPSDSQANACVEAVLGVLIHMYDTGSSFKFLESDKIYFDFKSYIVPITFPTCVLLNDIPSVDSLGNNISQVIDDLDSTLKDDTWYTKICLSILQEMVELSPVISLIRVLLIKVFESGKLALSSLVGFYLTVPKSSAEMNIIALLNKFAASNNQTDKSIKMFLNIVVLIRIGSKLNQKTFQNVFQQINLLKYYELAIEVKLFKTALMLFEDIPGDCERGYSKLQTIYENLDDDDLIHGLPERTDMNHTLSMINRFGSTFEKLQYASGCLDASLSVNESPTNAFIQSTSQGGLYGMSTIMSKNIQSDTNDLFEWSWKLSKWDLPVLKKPKTENEIIYKALKQIHDYQNPQHNQFLMLDLLKLKPPSELTSSVKEYKNQNITWLKTIACVSSIVEIEADPVAQQSLNEIFNNKTKWVEELGEFEMLENILQARQIAFQLKHNNSGLDDAVNQLVRYNDLARFCNEQQKNISSTVLLDKLCHLNFRNSSSTIIQNVNNLSLFQTAKTLWSQGNHTRMPIQMLQEVINNNGVNFPQGGISIDKCLVSSMMVEWLSESRQELSNNIMDKYVLPTALMAQEIKNCNQQSQVYKLLAQFCEQQYKSKSFNEQLEKTNTRVSNKIEEIQELKTHYSKISVSSDEKKSVQKFYAKLKLQLSSEENDLRNLQNRKESFGKKAVEFYLHNLIVGDFDEENLDKFFALWLQQSNNQSLNNEIKQNLLTLPSYKLITWCTQLVSRLGNENTQFQTILRALITNMCIDHPFHSLYLLISLAKHRESSSDNPLLLSKCLAVDKIWANLLKNDSNYINNILTPITTFCDECVKLAETKVSRGRTMSLEKLGLGQYWISNLPNIPPPTKDLRIDPTKMYKDIPVFYKIERKLVIASSGLSLPKIAKFKLSNGKDHKILFKHGTDDLRQDSIMEQVFKKVNNIFMKDRECKKRNLIIRTYNAVPIGPQSGVIEFVPDSIALIDVIKPFHQKLDEMKIEKARELMKQSQDRSKLERLQEFNKIQQKILPVLHYFFQNTFVTPDTWFESRIKYTHGIASSSIVGHILGLGDRHCNNILLDKHSGEPIHIDLGVAFDQGKQLPIPETVPFRLTRDIVDGFGITGVKGVFTQSCQHTFRVLRINRDHIISILDVLRWDPLYSWGLSPIRKKRLQDQEENKVILQPQEDGSEAGRAVSKVIDKLNANGLSIEAVVSELIQEATDPQNLALIYFGWCPFY